MRQRVARWLVGAAVAAALGLGLVNSTPTHATVFHPLGPTPTATPAEPGGNPGGGGGGHGGG